MLYSMIYYAYKVDMIKVAKYALLSLNLTLKVYLVLLMVVIKCLRICTSHQSSYSYSSNTSRKPVDSYKSEIHSMAAATDLHLQ